MDRTGPNGDSVAFTISKDAIKSAMSFGNISILDSLLATWQVVSGFGSWPSSILELSRKKSLKVLALSRSLQIMSLSILGG